MKIKEKSTGKVYTAISGESSAISKYKPWYIVELKRWIAPAELKRDYEEIKDSQS